MLVCRAKIGLAVLLGSLLSFGPAAAQTPAPPPAVTVVTIAEREITPTASFTGRVEAIDKVDLRARVQGFLERREFEEGGEVREGELLFVLEKGLYQAKVEERKAAILGAEGTLKLADIEVERQSTLVQRQATAQARLDEANAKESQAKGALLGYQAELQQAELDLSYTDIKSPIPGKVGRAAFAVGNYVGPESGTLATIVRQDPMYVNFPVTQRALLNFRKAGAEGRLDPAAVQIKLKLADGSIYPEVAKVSFIDVTVDPGTDTVAVRASLANPQGMLIDSQLVDVIVELGAAEARLVVPQGAVQFDQAGRFVLALDAESKVEVRRVTVGASYGTLYAVEEGLKAGDKVLVEGLQKVRPGIVVAPTEVPLPEVDSLAKGS